MQVYLVTGGWDSSYNDLSSTEILTDGSQSWSIVGPLPNAVEGLRGVSYNNRIIMTGNIATILYHNNLNVLQVDKMMMVFLMTVFSVLISTLNYGPRLGK